MNLIHIYYIFESYSAKYIIMSLPEKVQPFAKTDTEKYWKSRQFSLNELSEQKRRMDYFWPQSQGKKLVIKR